MWISLYSDGSNSMWDEEEILFTPITLTSQEKTQTPAAQKFADSLLCQL